MEKFLPEESCDTPVCVKGKRNCPPEDCGGPYGYQDLLNALASETHPRHKDMVQWIGPDYDVEYFDLEETNEMLQSEDYGYITLDWDE